MYGHVKSMLQIKVVNAVYMYVYVCVCTHLCVFIQIIKFNNLGTYIEVFLGWGEKFLFST